MIYPLEEFDKLSKNNQNLVEISEKDSEKSFLVGRFLIEGKNGFPHNIKLGPKYIEHSVHEKCVEAIFYYTELLIKGKIIPEDLAKANKYLTQASQLLNTKDSRQFLLRGLMSYKKNKMKEAVKFYSEGIKLGDAVCMYEGTEKNDKESINHFIKSNELCYSKSGHFLRSLNSLNQIKPFSKLPSETQMIFIKNMDNEQGSEFESIFLSPKKTEKVFFNKLMKSSEFYECLNHYQHINIEVGYPSESFKSILDLAIKIHKKNHNKLIIGLVFTSFRKQLK
ncbi:hypothetical protein M9Y10_030261 [Tritrichomonas musculus]|uniref:Uncharacterized protein n=1 Tax=Tritrichomonas musculus TaxID=1915356 RepID=A0ABR2KPG8_9EUKA